MVKTVLTIIFTMLVIISISSNIYGQSKIEVNTYWYSRVSESVKQPAGFKDFSEENPENIMYAISYLLTLEDDKSLARFAGATHLGADSPNVAATVDVAALFYISYLFYQNWQHADGVALMSANKKPNDPQTIKKAYSYYREWFSIVKTLGINKSRELNLDPLKGKDVVWW